MIPLHCIVFKQCNFTNVISRRIIHCVINIIKFIASNFKDRTLFNKLSSQNTI